MIKETVEYLANELNRVLNNGNNDPMYVLDNVARLDLDSSAASSGNRDKVLLTVVNIEEEKTLKNDPFYVRRNDPQEGIQIDKRNPTIYINLYLLVSCSAEYGTALDRIGTVLEYLQGKNVFTADTADPGDQYPEKVEKIILDLFSLNFEQVNHLWGVLGGKYVPSVLYKLRLLPIHYGRTQQVGRIEEIQANSHVNN
ncbi:MAG: DUF4255 domain-containing protein [Lewinellaceae bacterium]|nr:DUF4255 domain-containing protein [Lewinellaceae bacterium]